MPTLRENINTAYEFFQSKRGIQAELNRYTEELNDLKARYEKATTDKERRMIATRANKIANRVCNKTENLMADIIKIIKS